MCDINHGACTYMVTQLELCTCVFAPVVCAQLHLWAQNTPQSMGTSLQHHQHSCAAFVILIKQKIPTFVSGMEQQCSWNKLDSSHWWRQYVMRANIAKFDTIRRHSSSMWACQCSKRVSSIISPLCTWRCIAMLRLLPILLMFSSIQVSKTWFFNLRHFKTIQFAVSGVLITASFLWSCKRKGSCFPSSMSDLLAVFLDHWLIANGTDAAIVKRAKPKVRIHSRGQCFYCNCWHDFFVQDTYMRHRWVSDRNNLPCCSSPIHRIQNSCVRSIGVDLLTQISFMSMKKKGACSFLRDMRVDELMTNESMTWWVQNSRTPERLSKTQSSKPLRNRSISKLHSFALSLASLRMVWACKYSKALLPTLKSGHLRSKA